MMNKRGFLTVEVLISMVIIFMAILTLSSAIKSDIHFTKKIDFYENIYITTLSAQNMIKNTDIILPKIVKDFYQIPLPTKIINGFEIKAKAKKIKELKTYIYNPDMTELSGNKGKDKYILYQIQIKISQNNFEKEFLFYVTKIKRGKNEKGI